MQYRHVSLPERGDLIHLSNGQPVVTEQPLVGFIEGDGVGREIMQACLRVWDAAVVTAYAGRRKVQWTELFMGEKAARLYDGDFFPRETLDALKKLGVAVKGPLTTPVGGGFRSLNVSLRQMLDLYACIRPVRYHAGVPSPMHSPQHVDMVVFRENTEDIYAGIEYESGSTENARLASFLRDELAANFFEGAGLGIKPVSPTASRRLVRKAIQYALDHGRQSVTLVHKGNIMKFTEGAFRAWGYEVAREEFADYVVTEDQLWRQFDGVCPPGKVVLKDRIADIMFQLLLLRPAEFDVLATTNLNGDYLSDALAAQVGGVGIAPGANVSDQVAVFEATHGTAPRHAGKNKVNPGSLLFSGSMMFEYLGWPEVSSLIADAFSQAIQRGQVTYDLARQMEGATPLSTSQFADALIARIEDGARSS